MEEAVRLLCAGATRRHCVLRPEVARELVEQCGNDLNLLLNELDKLCAVAGHGEITSAIVGEVATKNLNAQAFELSNAILKHNYESAYTILHKLFASKLEPVVILAALSAAEEDLPEVWSRLESHSGGLDTIKLEITLQSSPRRIDLALWPQLNCLPMGYVADEALEECLVIMINEEWNRYEEN